MTNPKCNSLWLRSKSKPVYISKVTALKKKKFRKYFVLYKSSNFSLGEILKIFQNYWIVCLSFSQTNQAFTSLWKALGFEHLHTHMPRLFQPHSLRLLITSPMCLVLLSNHYIQFHMAYKVHLLFQVFQLPPTHHPWLFFCLARDPSLLLGQINRLKIKGRQ